MPKVPVYNNKPLKSIYYPKDSRAEASLKQKNYIAILCERRKIPIPYMKHMKSGEAAILISKLRND